MDKNKHFEVEVVGDRKIVSRLTDKDLINSTNCPTDYVEKKNIEYMLTQLFADKDIMKDDYLYILRYNRYDQEENFPNCMKQEISVVPVHYVREVTK